MTRNIACSVQQDITDQMNLIEDMSQVVEQMFEEAQKNGDKELLEKAETMALKLNELSKKAYGVGETVLANAA
ncbi:MAG: hypothetical protein PHW76_08580 [Alphaproteobacteria bacterium]|nr:hypothetical protein [Alphaproteobacteria bacterium]